MGNKGTLWDYNILESMRFFLETTVRKKYSWELTFNSCILDGVCQFNLCVST